MCFGFVGEYPFLLFAFLGFENYSSGTIRKNHTVAVVWIDNPAQRFGTNYHYAFCIATFNKVIGLYCSLNPSRAAKNDIVSNTIGVVYVQLLFDFRSK
ncbi:hypothetical protein D3C85_944740 [compost metagenome]